MNGTISLKSGTFLLSIMCLTLIASPYIPQRTNNIIKLSLEIIVIMGLTSHRIKKKSFISTIPVFCFFITMCFCTYHATGLGSRFMNAMVTGGSYFIFYFAISNYAKKYGIEYAGKIVKTNLLLYMIILDFFVIITWGKGLGGLDEAVYLIGNKFMVSYIHMMQLAFINLENKSKKTSKQLLKIFVFFVYSIAICLISDTTTGIVGLICVLVILIVSIKKQIILDIMRKPMVMIVFFLGINAIFLLTDILIGNSIISSFFYLRSHTSTMLSGRLVMYKIAMEAISKNSIWGYGINYDVVKNTLGFGNAQNGCLKILLDYGIVGTVFFCLTLYITFRNAMGENFLKLKNECVIFIYAMMVCSLVEINLAGIFMLVCALMNSTEQYNYIVRK